MKYVLDVSVAICWVIPRPLTPKAVRLRAEYQRQIHELLAPAVFIDEVAGALTKAERQKDIAVGQAAPLYVKAMNSPRQPGTLLSPVIFAVSDSTIVCRRQRVSNPLATVWLQW